MNIKKIIMLIFASFIGAVLGVYFGVIAPGLAGIADDRAAEIVDEREEESSLPINILLVGLDKSGWMADVIMLVSLDGEDGRIDILSIYRDTRIKLDGRFEKINYTYAVGGISETLSAVKDITGAPIHYYLVADLKGMEKLVDMLGGVEFNVPVNMKYSDPAQNLYINLKKGPQILDGNKALQLLRFRGYAEGDIQRTKVQREFIEELIRQKAQPQYLLKAPELFSEVCKYIKTNISSGDILKNLELIKRVKEAEVALHTLPGSAKYVGKTSYFLQDYEEGYTLCEEYFGGLGRPASTQYLAE